MPENWQREQLEERLKEIAKETLDIEIDDMTLDTRFDTLGMDSLDKLELLTAIEDELGLRIPDDLIQEVVTIESLVELLVELQQKPPETVSQSQGESKSGEA